MDGGGLAKWRLPFRVVLYVLVGWFVLRFNPFGISDKSDLASQDAIYRLLAPGYHSPARDAIVVVLLDEAAIQDLYEWQVFHANEWPVRYRDHAYLLGRILGLGPRALFVDVFFRRQRSTDDSFPLLLRVLERGQERQGVRVLLAGNFAGDPLTPDQEALERVADLSLNGWSGFGKAYPLRIGDEFTTAYELYRRVCLEGSPLAACTGAPLQDSHLEDGAALSVYWGSHSPGPLFPEFAHASCEPFEGTAWEVVRQAVHGFGQGLLGHLDAEEARVKCPYHRVIFGNELVAVIKRGTPEQKEALRKAIAGKVVLYGLSLDGLHDVVESPVHGQLPGVFLHAMALDNLMALGKEYIKASDDFIGRVNLAIWAVLAIFFAVGTRWLETRMVPVSGKGGVDEDVGGEKGAGQPGAGKVRAAFRHPEAIMFALGTLVVVAVSVFMFSVMDYEPLNSIGFISLLGAISLLRDSKLESHFVERLPRLLGRIFGNSDQKTRDGKTPREAGGGDT
ncbi:MAG TPA: CHASE2 domain-containing protein [Thiotrichales bacterium]|nr:CHASE2 domain-containing protein [Thiotrichales bacterium]